MRDFALLFRQADNETSDNVSKEDEQAINKKWHDWIGGIAAQGRLTSSSHLSNEGKVLKKGGVITDGPFVEIRERLGGFIVIKAENLDEATTLAHGCPILSLNGNVEIRPVS